MALKRGELFAILGDECKGVLGGLGMIVGSESARAPEDVDPSRDKPYQKITWRIISLLIVCCVVAFLNPQDVDFAKLQFLPDLRFSATVYRIGSGMFCLGYILSEIAINLSAFSVSCRERRKQGYSPVC
jgi:hypothetical protein